jgi:hypothetical protein
VTSAEGFHKSPDQEIESRFLEMIWRVVNSKQTQGDEGLHQLSLNARKLHDIWLRVGEIWSEIGLVTSIPMGKGHVMR